MPKLNEFQAGLKILKKYNPDLELGGGHERIYAFVDELVEGEEPEDESWVDEEDPDRPSWAVHCFEHGSVVSAKDAKKLNKLGWWIDREYNDWAFETEHY